MRDLAQTTRWRHTAETWFGKVAHRLIYDAAHAKTERRWLAGYEAYRLLDRVLGDAVDLVPLLEPMLEDDGEWMALDLEKHARTIAGELRLLRLTAKLENTAGRTPEEAQAFRDKAAALREAGRR